MLMGKGSTLLLLPITSKNRLSRCRQDNKLHAPTLRHAVVINRLSCFIHHFHYSIPPHIHTRYNNADTSFPGSTSTGLSSTASRFTLLLEPDFASNTPDVRVCELISRNPFRDILKRQRSVVRGAVVRPVIVAPERNLISHYRHPFSRFFRY